MLASARERREAAFHNNNGAWPLLVSNDACPLPTWPLQVTSRRHTSASSVCTLSCKSLDCLPPPNRLTLAALRRAQRGRRRPTAPPGDNGLAACISARCPSGRARGCAGRRTTVHRARHWHLPGCRPAVRTCILARICRHKLGVACAEKGPAEAAHPPLCCAAGRQAGRQAGRRAGRQAVEEQRHPRAQRWRRAELHVAWACARARWSALHSRHARRAGTGAELCLCPAGAPGCSLCFMAHAVPRRRRARGRVGARAAQTQEAAPLCRGTAWATRVQPPPPPLPRAAPTRAPRRTQRQRGAA